MLTLVDDAIIQICQFCVNKKITKNNMYQNKVFRLACDALFGRGQGLYHKDFQHFSGGVEIGNIARFIRFRYAG